jgi:hypothetical protein
VLVPRRREHVGQLDLHNGLLVLLLGATLEEADSERGTDDGVGGRQREA